MAMLGVCPCCKDYTASRFDLSDLCQAERQLVFLWACGHDITEYLDDHHASVPAPDDQDIEEVLTLRWIPDVFDQRFGWRDK